MFGPGREADPVDWLRIYPLLLQFSVGAVMCAASVRFGYSSGYLVPGDPNARRLVTVIWVGYFGLLGLAALFTFVMPYVGGEGPAS